MNETGKVFSLIVLVAAFVALTFGIAGCNKNDTQDTTAQSQPAQTDQSQDPAAAANLALTGANQATGTTVSRTRTIQITNPTQAARIRATASRCFKHNSPHHRCRNIRSLNVPAMAICGRRDIGAMLLRATIGCPGHGRSRLKWAICGRRILGVFRRHVRLQLRFLRLAYRLLRRYQLRIRLRRHRLSGQVLGRGSFQLQQRRQQYNHHQRSRV